MLPPSGENRSLSENSRSAIDDWRDLADIVALTTERLLAPVEGIHHAIADRWFRMAGTRVESLHRANRALTAGVYGSVRLTGTALRTAIGLGAAAADRRKPVSPMWRSPLRTRVHAVANALWGDELERRRADLPREMSLRSSIGEPIRLNAITLDRAFPNPSPRLVVLVHGLGETERCWMGRSADGKQAVGFADVLAADSFTPLFVRYNTGRHVSDNGLALTALIDEVVRCWPVRVEDIALVGNSMGGLVARSAAHAGLAAGHTWTLAANHLVTLGSPHLGSPLEKGANLISWGLRFAPETRPLREFLNQRSAGIKDLRFGAIREEDWGESNPDALLKDVVGDVSLPMDQHFMAGVVTGAPTHPIGALLGDLVVRPGSGTGRGRRRSVEATDVRVIGGRRHSDLLHDPAAHRQVRAWLGTGGAKRDG